MFYQKHYPDTIQSKQRRDEIDWTQSIIKTINDCSCTTSCTANIDVKRETNATMMMFWPRRVVSLISAFSLVVIFRHYIITALLRQKVSKGLKPLSHGPTHGATGEEGNRKQLPTSWNLKMMTSSADSVQQNLKFRLRLRCLRPIDWHVRYRLYSSTIREWTKAEC